MKKSKDCPASSVLNTLCPFICKWKLRIIVYTTRYQMLFKTKSVEKWLRPEFLLNALVFLHFTNFHFLLQFMNLHKTDMKIGIICPISNIFIFIYLALKRHEPRTHHTEVKNLVGCGQYDIWSFWFQNYNLEKDSTFKPLVTLSNLLNHIFISSKI